MKVWSHRGEPAVTIRISFCEEDKTSYECGEIPSDAINRGRMDAITAAALAGAMSEIDIAIGGSLWCPTPNKLEEEANVDPYHLLAMLAAWVRGVANMLAPMTSIEKER